MHTYVGRLAKGRYHMVFQSGNWAEFTIGSTNNEITKYDIYDINLFYPQILLKKI